MDRATVRQHLKLAEKHLARGEASLQRQRAIVDRLFRDGYDTKHARKVLKEFEELQAKFVSHRDQLRRELA